MTPAEWRHAIAWTLKWSAISVAAGILTYALAFKLFGGLFR